MEGRGNCVVRRAVWTVCKLERIECVGEAVFDFALYLSERCKEVVVFVPSYAFNP